MNFFYKYFGHDNKVYETTGEMEVTCPFPHKNPDGSTYFESNPSAHINVNKSVFHCKSCKVGMSEAEFMMHLQGISYREALHLLSSFDKREEAEWGNMQSNLKNSQPTMEMITHLGINSVVDELKLGYEGDGIGFPVFVYNELLDVRTYHPDATPKVRSRKGKKPLILPFDLWREDDRPTLLCAGEKDMAIARVKGFNAITFTGGEGAFPKLFKASFRGKHIYIVYDNDGAGTEGAVRVATLLKENGATPYIVNLSTVCTEKGEDIHDFFQKYKKTSQDLQSILDSTPAFNEDDYQKARNEIYPLISLADATEGRYSGRLVSSRVAIVASYEEVYHIPEMVEYRKTREDDGVLSKDTVLTWELEERNIRDILRLMDSNLKEDEVDKNLKRLANVPINEKNISTRKRGKRRVFKAVATDDIESEVISDMDTTYQPTEIILYSLDDRLEAGQKYRVFYYAHSHPLQAQKVVGIVTRMETSDNSINNFKVNESVLDSLKVFQGDPDSKLPELFERFKAIAGAETQKSIFYTTELFYHTPLQFYFGDRLERAYLEPMICGESRTGKSQTAKKMLETYELGTFTSLKTSTVAGLIGGSDKTLGGGFKTRLGVIPRNHKGAIIFEEFSGGGKDFIRQLTDIRSSNMVRIARVNGETKAPAFVRMLSISNQATKEGGQSIPLRQYPNGVKVLLDLIGAAEDVARYDFFVLVDKPDRYTRPNEKVDATPLPKESYMNRVRWVWSRKPEQIMIDESVQNYIVDSAEKLNEKYDCHINFFGAEAWKKLARIAIAVAGTLCSMDTTGEKIIVKAEHVSWAKKFMVACYDNDLFKLKGYVDNERQYREVSSAAVHALQGLYDQYPQVIHQLENNTEMTMQQLKMVGGVGDKLDYVTNRLYECHFFNWQGEHLVPSQRFRDAARRLNRVKYMKKVGSI